MSKVAKVINKKKNHERKENPFENRSQKVKFDVLGKKVIGRDVRLSHSRSRAEQKVIRDDKTIILNLFICGFDD